MFYVYRAYESAFHKYWKNLENIVGFGLLFYALYRWKAIEESE